MHLWSTGDRDTGKEKRRWKESKEGNNEDYVHVAPERKKTGRIERQTDEDRERK